MRWRARPVVTFSMIALLFLALVAVVLVASRESADTTATSQESAVLRTPAGAVSMDVALVADKIKGGWVGQMAGVTWGAPTEFRWLGRIMPESAVPRWTPRMINAGFDQDDIYVEIPLLDAMKDNGVNCSWETLGDYFRDTRFQLWHANREARDNLLHGIPSPESGHYSNNEHCDDIDWQIESDFVGQMAPGQVNAAIEMAWRTGHVMNYGDGVYGGVFVAAMHAQAFTASSVDLIIEAGRQAVPEGSEYRQVIEDVIAWEEQGNSWEETWQLLQDKWGQDDRCPEGVNNPFNIDAKLNGAYVLMGLLYGDGDFEQSMRIAMRAGQDSDCNPSSVGGILGNYLGYSNLPDKWKSALDSVDRTFAFTEYNLNDAVDVNLQLAKEVLLMGGGSISGVNWVIPDQVSITPPILEQWPDATNDRPVLNASAEAPQGRTVRFSASASDADGIKAFQWHFGDLSYADGPNVSHTYRQDGVYDAICYVTDSTGNTTWKAVQVVIDSGSRPTPTP
jgi:ADP-ribosylglycohydrolase